MRRRGRSLVGKWKVVVVVEKSKIKSLSLFVPPSPTRPPAPAPIPREEMRRGSRWYKGTMTLNLKGGDSREARVSGRVEFLIQLLRHRGPLCLLVDLVTQQQ